MKHTEIERKFLLSKEAFLKQQDKLINATQIEQSYLSYLPELRIRKSHSIKENITTYELTVKQKITSSYLERKEINIAISEEEYENLLTKKENYTINKTRYELDIQQQLATIDVYEGTLQGLMVLEIEFSSLEDAKKFQPPLWLGQEITEDKKYKNSELSKQ